MNKLKRIKFYIDSLCIYNIKNDEVIKKLRSLLENAENESVYKCYSEFFNALTKRGDSLKHYISSLILFDENVFSRAAASDEVKSLSSSVISGVKSDLEKLDEISQIKSEDILNESNKDILKTLPKWEIGEPAEELKCGIKNAFDVLTEYHRENGYGAFAKNCAFTWRNREFAAITSIDTIRLTDLKNYERQRNQVIDNTLAFLSGFPANNILLYGDRGTGKSSTVHAILNEYKNRGLRIIEISKGDICDLTLIREKIADNPMKFIIFIDDLSFDKKEDSLSQLKAALEGTLSKREGNALIYATSNRRHIVKENFTDRENDVHSGDTIQEELSLSDRFGLAINFLNPDKKDFIDIVLKIASDRDFDYDEEELVIGAEQWARRRGGRSPRCAKQYIDYLEASKKMVKNS
ncbi:MAG: ATP-binding protein [Eubacterium sp.]|nr:ATP-binding protein [Eubacterium sp.]